MAKNKKPHTIEEELIMPAAEVLVKHVIGDEAKLKSSPYGGTELKIRICHTTGRNNRRVELCTAFNICALCYYEFHLKRITVEQ